MLQSQDRQYTSHSTIVSEVAGEKASYSFNTSIVPDYRVPYFLSNNSQNKAATTLEQLFVGIASRSGLIVPSPDAGNSGLVCDSGFLPFINVDDPDYTDESNSSLLSRFTYGVSLALGQSGIIPFETIVSGEVVIAFDNSEQVVKSVGFALPMYAAGFGYDINNNFVPANKTVGIEAYDESDDNLVITRTNHLLLSGNFINIEGSVISDYNDTFEVIDVIDRDNFVLDVEFDNSSGTLRYPNTGRYSAVNVNPYAPSGQFNPSGYVNTINYTDDTVAWKAGPVDLRWDASRQVWCGSDFFKGNIIFGYLASDITPALGKNVPSGFRVNTYVPQTLPVYIESIDEDDTGTTNGGTLFTLVPNSLELIPGDTFKIKGTNSSYDNTYTLLYTAGDGTELVVGTIFDADAADSITTVGYVDSGIGNEDAIPRVVDQTYIVNNYDTNLSVELNSTCLNISGGCVTVQKDVFIAAIIMGPNDIRQIYVGS